MTFLYQEYWWFFLFLIPFIFLALRNFSSVHRFLLMSAPFERKKEFLTIFYIKKILILFLTLLGLVFLLLALSGPSRTSLEDVHAGQGLDLVFLVDISVSMLAEDSKNRGINRLDMTRHFLKRLVQHIAQEGQSLRVALLAFKGESVVFLPLTEDILSFERLLDSLDPRMISTPGSMIFPALRKAYPLVESSNLRQSILVLASDGQDWSSWDRSLLHQLRDQGIQLAVLGLGGDEAISFENSLGQKVIDKEGHFILSRQERVFLEKLAVDAGGQYIDLSQEGLERTLEIFNKNVLKGSLIRHTAIAGGFILGSLIFFLLSLIVGAFRWKKLF